MTTLTERTQRMTSDERGAGMARENFQLGTCEAHVNPKVPHALDDSVCIGWCPMGWSMGAVTRRPTNYYSLSGAFTKNGVLVTDAEEIDELCRNWMVSAGRYHGLDGFRFVDASAHGTISDGFVSLNWSDFGTREDDGQ